MFEPAAVQKNSVRCILGTHNGNHPWANYIDSGHGGNKELIELVNKEGMDYIKGNFQYSILENYNAKVDDSVILERESWWKETLQSRKFGYNAN